MKPMKRTLTLLTAILLAAALMTGCTKLTEAKDNTPSATDAPAETGDGVYVKLEWDDVASLYIHGGSFSKVCENADGSPLKAGEWIYTGEDIVEISKKDNCSVVFTVGATAADDTLLAEGTFLYDAVQEKLYVTISADGVTCSTSDAADAPADVPPVLTLPVLDEIDTSVMVGVSGSSLSAVQAAVSLLNWGTDTGLGADEIGDATSTWLASKNDGLTEFLQKLELVDEAYQKLLTDQARDLLDRMRDHRDHMGQRACGGGRSRHAGGRPAVNGNRRISRSIKAGVRCTSAFLPVYRALFCELTFSPFSVILRLECANCNRKHFSPSQKGEEESA